MPDFLLEIYSEEIPARMQCKATKDLGDLIIGYLIESGLMYVGIRRYWTPRRLSIYINGIAKSSPDKNEERLGPRVNSDKRAIDGFLRSTNLQTISECEVKTDSKKGDFYLAKIKKKGRLAEEILEEIVPLAVRKLHWPKSMRWGTMNSSKNYLSWIRPLQSIICILTFENGERKIINANLENIPFGDITYGHRFHSPQPIKVRCLDDYVQGLEKAKVLLDPKRRRDIIINDINQLVLASGLELVEDNDLLEEVVGLVEWVHVLIGSFDEKYLCLPEELIRLTIKTHQKCFVTRNHQGKLSNHFILVANIQAYDGGLAIIQGNSRVIAARLADALHFWRRDQEDLQNIPSLEKSAIKFNLDLSKPLDQRMAKLDTLNVVFHAKIGTQGDRISRIRLLAKDISRFTGADVDLVDRAAVLAKADLCTEIVREFPELQGKIGSEYAALQGEDESVVIAIEEHLKPRGPLENICKDKVSITLALADKIDILVNFWAINEKPSGSKDPYALRRTAIGIIRIILENKVHISLSEFIEDQYLILFLHDRLKLHLRDIGICYDLIEAIFLPDNYNILIIVDLISHLNDFIESDKGKKFLLSAKRIFNIIASEERKGQDILDYIDPKKFSLEPEQELYNILSIVNEDIKDITNKRNYYNIGDILFSLHKPIEVFFEKVLVNIDNQEIRANRLALLKSIQNCIMMLFDFNKIK
ncbi:glycine--tRNA ligase subunit beta [Candidatus Liberibacter americanus]|uniref:Glycine--tRNA ligase beta subunit n=1 Tax=Candidatus Liberibacter americanus str. Sao Paulo TaxID=1261131 RepID=U6B7Y5_9HYPH|nr:glycine--tRNA ligase subunit beta [Candidatus Liberibacter americanus]AHA27971.1 Glycyl-tRNA synthetase, beta subunit [Candidatus Liberibacter americanus str. Sao Paulo]EMS35870.1 glycyl-tRNA synthetase subunit beta [Candidatus Liberibacter americanus PW_SP]